MKSKRTKKNHLLSKTRNSNRARTKSKPVGGLQKPANEQCWYCELTADAGAEATVILKKTNADFQYLVSDPDQEEIFFTQVEIPRCVECKIAHNKLENPRWNTLLFCSVVIVLLGVYFGIFIKTLSWWIYPVIGLLVSAAIAGIALGASRNHFSLPGKIKHIIEVREHEQVRELLSKGWKVKI
jgi:hypothetical protein